MNDAAPLAGGAGVNRSNSRTDRSPLFTIVIRPVPDGMDRFGRAPVERLRGGLKMLLRTFGLRAVSVREGRP